ncbi:hypothetical protein EDD86DRAFT_204590 [Gorgonomyces haynaldii]|nr:hypothetical protein EDD86DRAFT_204590 [Gorgonomyces haynaldii]
MAQQLIQQLKKAGLNRRILPEKDLSSKLVNGTSTFVPQICKIELHCNQESTLKNWMRFELSQFTAQRPYCVFEVKAKDVPKIVAHYSNGSVHEEEAEKTPKEITQQLNALCDARSAQSLVRKIKGPIKRGTNSDHEWIYKPFNSLATKFRP